MGRETLTITARVVILACMGIPARSAARGLSLAGSGRRCTAGFAAPPRPCGVGAGAALGRPPLTSARGFGAFGALGALGRRPRACVLGARMEAVSSKAYDQEQLRLLDSDECILVNERDEVVGSASKKFCHLMANIDEDKALHRAFSVFLFNTKGELLLQKRSSDKILFPERWTNTCCSHPLHTADELDNPPSPTADGVRRAAVRKLEHELGIPLGQVPAEAMQYMTRIVYKAAVGEDDTWGEHEVDYILVGTADAETNLNPNEVSEIRYVPRGELEGLLAAEDRGELMLSPWFRLIARRWLPLWWDALLRGELEKEKDTESIHIIN